jgi:hypothetical protein
VYGDKAPVVKNVFTLKGCLPIVGTQVITSDTEQELLLKWQQFLQATDVDIITGYNVQNFDIPYVRTTSEGARSEASEEKRLPRRKRTSGMGGGTSQENEGCASAAESGERGARAAARLQRKRARKRLVGGRPPEPPRSFASRGARIERGARAAARLQRKRASERLVEGRPPEPPRSFASRGARS